MRRRIEEFVEDSIERRMGLSINREKSAIRNLAEKGNNLEFLGYVFRQEKAFWGKGLKSTMQPSSKALKSIRSKITEITSTSHAFTPIAATIASLNLTLTGWAQYFSIGFCAPAYRTIDEHARYRLIKHLRRRSQRPYRCPSGMTWYRHVGNLGLIRLSTRLRPV